MPVEDSWKLLCHCGILWRDVVNSASGGQLENALPLWNTLERFGKLNQLRTVERCSAIIVVVKKIMGFFGDDIWRGLTSGR